MACSAADRMFDCGALTTMTPRSRGGGDVDVVEADPGPADHLQLGAGGEHLGVTLVAERMMSAARPDPASRSSGIGRD